MRRQRHKCRLSVSYAYTPIAWYEEEVLKLELREIEKIAKENYSAAKLQNRWYECVSFALYLLDEKIESENIYILAGLDSDDYDNINKYFFAVISEFKILKDR